MVRSERHFWRAIAFILIWVACAPVTYTLLKRDWIRPQRNPLEHGKLTRNEWTVGIRSGYILISSLGPCGLMTAAVVVGINSIPDDYLDEKAAW